MRKPAHSIGHHWIGGRPVSRSGVAPQRGVTLVELLVVMATAGVLAAIATPSFSQLAASLQLTSATNALVSSLHLARSEAIKRNSRVVVCKTADGIACATYGGWEQGWIVFHDTNNNGLREGAEAVIQTQVGLPSSLRVTGNATVSCYISFAPTGGTKLVGGGFQAGTITLCRASATAGDARQIVLNAAGRPRVTKGVVPSCE